MKREIIHPVTVAFLLLAYWLLGFLLHFFVSKKWVQVRLMLGAAILSLTCVSSCAPPRVSCYEMSPVDSLTAADSASVTTGDTTSPKPNNGHAVTNGVQNLPEKDTVIRKPDSVYMIRCYVPPHEPDSF